ncbi:MAG TPA: hypothetical protein VHF07_05240 [Nitrospiraceae bacterium]|nr:hypothetical protein [Nitrospiraceae bacterium]
MQKEVTISIERLAYLAVLSCSLSIPAFGQEPILPHGDPRLQSSEEEKARREEIRDQRLKQQGQGSHYRIEGEPQPPGGKTGTSSDEPRATGRQDTGISDPTVNPGQAAGMETIQGRVIESNRDRHVIRQRNGIETTLMVDAETRGDTDLHPGDVITGTVTSQGRAVAVQKKSDPGQNP